MRLSIHESREILELPASGDLDDSVVKAAFKRMALQWYASLRALKPNCVFFTCIALTPTVFSSHASRRVP